MRETLSDFCARTGSDALLREWDAARNGSLTPRDVSYGSRVKPWWRCEKGHEWQAAVYSRTKGAGCPYCAGKRVRLGDNSFAAQYPALAREWHREKNRALPPPDQITPGSHRTAWWICEKGHEWSAEVKNRVAGSGCPYCTNRRVLAGFNDLATTHPALAAEWDGEKNAPLSPENVLAGSDRRVWWRCSLGHAWRAPVSSRSRPYANGCPVCAGRTVLPGFNDLASAHPLIASEWDAARNAPLTPEQVTAYSNKKAWWLCPLGHSYAAQVHARVKGSGCPVCAGRRVLPGFNDLASQEPKVAAQWHPTLNGALTPEMVTCGTNRRAWWICAEGHVWHAAISSRAGKQKCGCPVCAGRTRGRSAARYQQIIEQRAPRAAPERRVAEDAGIS